MTIRGGRVASALSLALLVGSLGVGCVAFGEGTAEFAGALTVPRCTIAGSGNYVPAEFADFRFSAGYIYGQLRGDVLELRLQRDPRPLHQTDAVVIQIRDVRSVTTATDIEVRPDLETDTGVVSPVRISLQLKNTCPRFLSNLLGRGTINFSQFDPRDDGLVEAQVTIDVVDAQEARLTGTEAVRGRLTGTFRIPLHLVPQEG